MARKVWVGTVSGHVGEVDWAGNWVPVNKPVNGDDVEVGPGGPVSMTSGLDQSAVTLNSFTRTSAYTGNMGTAGGYLKYGVSSVLLNGTGKCFLDVGTGTTIASGIVAGSSTTAGDFSLRGNWIEMVINKGVITIDTGTLTALILQYASTIATDAVVTLNTPTVTRCDGLAGTLTMGAAGTITTLVVGPSHTATITTGTLTNLQNWGSCIWNTPTTLVSAKCYAGTLNASGSPQARTITLLEMYMAAAVNLANGQGNIDLTSFVQYGRNIPSFDPRRTLAIS